MKNDDRLHENKILVINSESETKQKTKQKSSLHLSLEVHLYRKKQTNLTQL